jgi:hypothetical protein
VRVLTDRPLAELLVRRGLARIRSRYDWDAVGRRTVEVYARAIEEEAALTGGADVRRPLRAILHDAPILELGSAG